MMNRMCLDLLSLFFPKKCMLCLGPRTHGEVEICSTCLMALPRERNYRGDNNNTTRRLSGMMKFRKAYSFLQYNKKSDVQKLVHGVKYRGMVNLGWQLGKWFAAEVLLEQSAYFDLIVPVPLHKEKFISRGFNQCLLIASGINAITGHPVVEALERVNVASTQTQLSRWDRFENTANEFVLNQPRRVFDQRVLLLDDIITTGATISGSAVPLTVGGVQEIIVAAVGLTQEK